MTASELIAITLFGIVTYAGAVAFLKVLMKKFELPWDEFLQWTYAWIWPLSIIPWLVALLVQQVEERND